MSSSNEVSTDEIEDANHQRRVDQYSADTKRREFRRDQAIAKKGLRRYHVDLYTVEQERSTSTEDFLFRTAIEDAGKGNSFLMIVMDASTGEDSRSVLSGAPNIPEPGEMVLFNGRGVPVIAARLMLQRDDASYSAVFVDVLVDATA
jgi:hypothetical protein